MKKILFASTALVAAGLIGAGSAEAAEKISLKLGGFSKWWVVGAWQDDNKMLGSVASDAAYANVDVKGDNEVFFGGSTTLDNGLKVGVDIQLEAGGSADNSADVIDESYVWIEGGFGKFIVGSENNGAYLLHVTAPDAAGNWGEGSVLGYSYSASAGGTTGQRGAIAQPTAVTTMLGGNTTAINPDSDAEKITYVAPSFAGLTVGASYVPNAASNGDNQGVEYSVVDAWGAGALYANTFGGVGVKVSAGYVTYDLGAGGATGTSTGGGRDWEASAGAQLSYAGFTLGGSYRHQSDEENSNATSSNDGRAWDIGLQYATGPYSVSIAYFNSKAEGLVTAGEDKIEWYQASAKYSMGPGVDLLGTIGRIEYKDESATDANKNEGWAVMTGLSLAF